MLTKKRLFFLGAGSMAEAMIKGLLAAQLLPAEQISVSTRKRTEHLQELSTTYGIHRCQDKRAEIEAADIIIIAVKPFDVATALQEVRESISARQMVISVAAGIATEDIESCFSEQVPVIRAMPNTSSFVQESATALCGGRWADQEHIALAENLFSAIGISVVVKEGLMNAVTGLSGSGPAYFYYVFEGLIQAGLECGLPEETCRTLLLQTVYGAAKMLKTTGKEPAELRRQVTSPNGTTMAGISVLEQGDVLNHFVQAVKRATQRSEEMGRQSNPAHV
ncbi:pyrroline-5-carboxylate reductase [Tengunoibacter tsumagoiensis]|uniref:Pyrroline-5-carboxylate reductase n=1 Tax=Tengunoibacter tsumagoiensis TaxID=2014871 RepID=A0A402AB37_9CHLR|nr:pyrroline-5-carboxylate reductase [Tengunoibacter tsumagoiensis]GCE16175.1 pyrroline-5-carboxylate reductase [Tengunoibacter tsumagoiensis]